MFSTGAVSTGVFHALSLGKRKQFKSGFTPTSGTPEHPPLPVGVGEGVGVRVEVGAPAGVFVAIDVGVLEGVAVAVSCDGVVEVAVGNGVGVNVLEAGLVGVALAGTLVGLADGEAEDAGVTVDITVPTGVAVGESLFSTNVSSFNAIL